MSFKQLLQDKLKEKISDKELEILPSGFQAVGNIAILNLNTQLLKYKKEIAQATQELFPRFKTICNKTGEISGTFREPQIEVILGKETEVINKESGCLFKFDVTKIMFAKGNQNEKRRIASQVEPGETIIDMFAGIGYFTLPMAKLAKPKIIYSIELNPTAFKYLNENLKLNKINNVKTINGNSNVEVSKLFDQGIIADRVMMGYLPEPKEFLESAFKIIKDKGIIHYECIVNEKEHDKSVEEIELRLKTEAEKLNKTIKILKINKVKDYAPHLSHCTFDVQVFSATKQ
jgi:tRNA wybutosine-synthesizing protein 2